MSCPVENDHIGGAGKKSRGNTKYEDGKSLPLSLGQERRTWPGLDKSVHCLMDEMLAVASCVFQGFTITHVNKNPVFLNKGQEDLFLEAVGRSDMGE